MKEQELNSIEDKEKKLQWKAHFKENMSRVETKECFIAWKN
jgi:hypothetical protein